MSISKTWNNSTRNIPQAGDVGWPDLTDFLVDLATNAQTTNKQLVAARTSTSASTTVTATTDCYVGINYAGAAAVFLPAGVNGQLFIISDESNNASVNNITITPNGANTINNGATLVLNANNQKVFLAFNNGDWKVLANSVAVPVTATSTTTLSNKTLDNTTIMTIKDANLTLQDDVDTTKVAKLQLSAITTGTTRTYTLPDATVTLVGDTATQTLSNKTLDNTTVITTKDSNTTIQNSADTTKQAKFDASTITTGTTRTYSLPNTSSQLVNLDATQILTNKDIDGATASNTSRITLPKNTKSNLDALTRKQGTIVFASDQNKAYVDNGSSLVAVGSGSAGLYPTVDFEDNSTGGISTYSNGAVSIPTTGTGGSPVSTFTVNSTTPLRGTYDGVFTKSAANRQGEGFSLPITLSNADVGKTIQVIFDFKTSANFVSGDMVFYVYDVTNSVLITPSQTVLPTGTSSQFSVAFNTTTGTSYRLIWHVATTSALAYTVNVDQISYSSIVRPIVSGLSDWIAYTPTFSAGFGTVTNAAGEYRREGDNMRVRVTCTTGTVAASLATVTLPSSYTIDSTKLTITANTTAASGNSVGTYGNAGGNNNGYVVTAPGTSTSLVYFGSIYSGANPLIAQNGSAILLSTTVFSAEFLIPIAQFSSGITLSSTGIVPIEYASNSSSTDADDSTSFVSGALGSSGVINTTAITVAGGRKKRIRFTAPIQPTDNVWVEVSKDRLKWYPLTGYDNGTAISSGLYQNGILYGININTTVINSTDLDITFGQYATASGATYASAGLAWTGTGVAYWRVVKRSSIGAAELAPATEFSSGTVGGYSQWATYTPTLTGFGTATSISAKYRREGDSMRVRMSFIPGTVTATIASASLPGSYTIDSNKLTVVNTTGTYGNIVGTYGGLTANQAGYILTAPSTSSSLIYFGNGYSSANMLLAGVGSNVATSSTAVSLEFLVPISGWN